MSEHTPGPWHLCGAPNCPCRMIWSGDQEVVVAVAHGEHWSSIESIGDPWPIDSIADANARLIAVAPELLDALRECRGDLARLIARHSRSTFISDELRETYVSTYPPIVRADAAIARTEGREP